ncbi:acyl-CoA thioesterase [Alteromonas macleodii]|jgi:acyl-CoA hydrolase|uniref:Cytosolic long-chain acyl-CoA thioester hydrolase family protein n=1 Tax=Alteromonas macleodii (strain English Channel 673) TaxID=1004788 RepID=A0AB32ZWQ7_ALTME|nr:acyl-CoA thioesterase [Alteromonas macleodii]AFT73728.1 cytosolic long-chain acyl-CoA thioester hydrolase family protein [Alteromonas macleodii str. 'English Channel 673']MBL3808758.1 acyl-CoA thioesterase [Alteromonas macleodii]MBL3882295.1 acyl-CoA thioesterase [Alteromonas macleodii]CAI2389212.1 Acyl-CoA hydrolase [Alteromonas macleodii]CAI3940820.1 Acyl-CoA hydrolase [Alteromonas macleodii]
MAHPSTTFRFLAEPTDVNFGGNVHGGIVMKWIDQAAYACAAQWSKCYCVTVSANGIRFIKPIKVGQLVEITASLVHTGASSMHIYVVVKSGDATENTTSVANRCFITFMAVDCEGNPVNVPAYVPEDERHMQLELVAMHAKDFAKQLDSDFTENIGFH